MYKWRRSDADAALLSQLSSEQRQYDVPVEKSLTKWNGKISVWINIRTQVKKTFLDLMIILDFRSEISLCHSEKFYIWIILRIKVFRAMATFKEL